MAVSWLSSQFIEKVLRSSENDNSIYVANYSIEPATNKGDNLSSIMHRVTVEFRRSQRIKKAAEKKSIIIKVAPLNEGPQKELVVEAGLFDTEIKMMTTTLKEMQFLLKNTKLVADCYFKQETSPFLLVIEDLAPLGYRMANRIEGLDLDHSVLAIRGLAKFHASSVAVCEKKPEYKRMYRKGLFHVENPPARSKFYINSMRTLVNCIKNWPELGPEYYFKLEKFVDIVYAIGCNSQACDASEFNVINHGDLWVNNMLFKYDDKGKVNDHIFVDFQQCVYGSPALDISHFFNTSLANHVFMNNQNELINEYLDVLTTTMKNIGCKTVPPSMNDLQEALRKREPYSFIAACTILPAVLTKPDEALEFDELLNQDDNEFNVKAFENEAFKKIITRRIIDWNDTGFFDECLQL